MFKSISFFEKDLGVDKRIARFFVDRRVPKENAYWKGRLIYISSGNGYNIMPIFYDILYRIGIPLESLLEEQHILFMEEILHLAALEETKVIDKATELSTITGLLKGRIKDEAAFARLHAYLSQPRPLPTGEFGTPYPALNRADNFLFVLCDLPVTEAQWKLALRYWYAVITTILLLDDLSDYEKDKREGEENAVLEMGEGIEGFRKAEILMSEAAVTLNEISPAFSAVAQISFDHKKDFIPAEYVPR